VLDALAGNGELLQQYRSSFFKWKDADDKLNALIEQKNNFNKEYDYQKFLFDELDEASFQDNELEDADTELKMLSNAESIKFALEQAGESLSGGDMPLVHQLKSIEHQLTAFTKYHTGLDELVKRLHSAQIEIKDIADEVDRINEDVVYDPARIEQLNERIAAGYKLLKKHGVQTTSQLQEIHRQLDAKLRAVMNIDDLIAEAQKETEILHKEAEEFALKLSDKRAKQVKPLTDKVNTLLAEVGMPNARLKVVIEEKTADASGRDDVEFLFDANKSNRFESIRKVASGGELSRLMLCIKSLVAESIDLATLIFDEIDTGISGEAARQVGLIMSGMAGNRQLITITHQPQIAGRANAHLFVYKDMKNGAVRTGIRQLTGDERITAIARMLSGEKPTAAAMENAREMVMN
jgi:DNA repair protein RecN (Recombination protein N)